MRIALDTNAFVELRRGHATVADLVRRAEGIVLSAIVAGELLYGFRHGTRYQRNRQDLDAFLESPGVVLQPVTMVTAERFGSIAASLRRKGTPIPTNDVWIAAHVLETGTELVSLDRHFEAIDNLPWIHVNA